MRTIAQRQLRNQSGEILRQAEAGEQFAITVGGRRVALLGPLQQRQWVPRAEVMRLLRSLPPDPAFFDDIEPMGGKAEDLVDPWQR